MRFQQIFFRECKTYCNLYYDTGMYLIFVYLALHQQQENFALTVGSASGIYGTPIAGYTYPDPDAANDESSFYLLTQYERLYLDEVAGNMMGKISHCYQGWC